MPDVKRCLVVNCSHPHYNLGAAKLANYLRSWEYDVTEMAGHVGLLAQGYDLVALSVIFSWHALVARDIAELVKHDAEVWCGGPGMFALRNWWKREVGLTACQGIDRRFEFERGKYLATFASRGCPVGCYFCIVPKLEGTNFTLDWDFQPAPLLYDNNLSALPVDFQRHVIRRYKESGVTLKDANSGFEPRTFDEGTYRRWKDILKGPWRFAFDTWDEEQFVRPMMQILRDVPSSRKRVYVLIGNEPYEQCRYRAERVIEWGGEPYCQPVMPLNALSREDIKVAYDWTRPALKDFTRFYNRFLWHNLRLEDYRPRVGEPAPFKGAA